MNYNGNKFRNVLKKCNLLYHIYKRIIIFNLINNLTNILTTNWIKKKNTIITFTFIIKIDLI